MSNGLKNLVVDYVDSFTEKLSYVTDGISYESSNLPEDLPEDVEPEDVPFFVEAVESAGHSIVMTDDDGRIKYVNDAFEDQTGYSQEEVIGEDPSMLNSGEHDEEFFEDMWETIGSGDVWREEVTNRDKSGEKYVIDQVVSPVFVDGEMKGYVGTNIDITEMKEKEREIEEKNDMMGDIFDMLSHDIPNITNIAKGNLDLYRETDDPDRLDNVENALQRIEGKVSDTRDLVDMKSYEDEMSEIDLDSLVTECWGYIESPGATLEFEDGEYTMKVHEDHIKNMFENLFDNAIKHGGENVTVYVGELDNGFYIEDDGEGIPDERKERVLEKGFTDSEDGTGIGLSVVGKVADIHGWDLSIEDGRHGGARFEFYESDTEEE